MKLPHRYRAGSRIVHFPTNCSGEVIAVLPKRQRLIATTGFDQSQDRRFASVVHVRDLRRGVASR